MKSTEANQSWNRTYSRGITDLETLNQFDWLKEQDLQALEKVKNQFDIRVPEAFFQGISEKDFSLEKQVIPRVEELTFFPEELEDPIGDEPFSPIPGITHRYPDRVLLKATYLCGVYCRFCFRRYKVSDHQQNLSKDHLAQALEYIAHHPEIWEVILTGGDPLVFSDEKMNALLQQLSKNAHLKIIRFHTRMVTALPQRITEGLIHALKRAEKRIWIAIHVNSPSELTAEACRAIQRLVENGISLVSQTVLLKEVNDQPDVLVKLFRHLVELGVKPYYLHYPDLAQGTNHFRIPLDQAIELVKGLRGKISGLCIPQLIVDIPGGHGKIAMDPQFATQLDSNRWVFESPTSGKKIEVCYPPS